MEHRHRIGPTRHRGDDCALDGCSQPVAGVFSE